MASSSNLLDVVKEDALLPGLDRFLHERFNDDIDQTAEILAGHDELEPEVAERQAILRAQIKECDRRLERYRTALDHADGEISSIIKWIAEVEHERRGLERQLGRVVPGGRLTKAQIKALVVALRDIVSVLAEADVDDRTEVYQQLGVELIYHPDGRVAVEALPRGLNVCVGGTTRTVTPRAATVGWFDVAA